MKRLLHFLLLMIICTQQAQAQSQRMFEIPLWNDKPAVQSSDPTDTATVRVYLPDPIRATGKAVVICPGGAYQHLAMDHEGYMPAQFLANEGVVAVVLKYRMPHGKKEVPISDAEEAMRLVRRNAHLWNVNVNQVGIMGFSAGGHLASTIATHAKGDAIADFQILFYPVISMLPGYTHQGSHDNLLGRDAKKKEQNEYSNDLAVSRVTPRALIIASDDDNVVMPANSLSYATELYRHDVPVSIHIYPTGGHGYGFRSTFVSYPEIAQEIKAWLKSF